MRLKEDGDSWKAGGIKRRDFRNSRDEPEVMPYRSHKNKKRWCKGIINREHVIVNVEWTMGNLKMGRIDKCQNCHKEIKHYFEPRWK